MTQRITINDPDEMKVGDRFVSSMERCTVIETDVIDEMNTGDAENKMTAGVKVRTQRGRERLISYELLTHRSVTRRAEDLTDEQLEAVRNGDPL